MKKQPEGCFFVWQGRQESNPQPMVLETTTLPVELLPYASHMNHYIHICPARQGCWVTGGKKMEDRYLVIYAGGTIGMAGKVLAAHDSAAIEAAVKELPKHADLIRLPEVYDSSALDAERIRALMDTLEMYHKDYQGFLILFGTDTMAYLHSILKWSISALHKPIAITGSVKFPEEDPTEGQENIRQSLAFLRKKRGQGEVAIVMGGRALINGSMKFDTGASLPYLESQESVLEALRQAREREGHWQNPVFRKVRDMQIEVLYCQPFMKLSQEPIGDGLILCVYGQGTLPPLKALRTRAEAYCNSGRPVIILSQCPRNQLDMRRYAGGSLLDGLDIPAYSGSFLEEGLAYMLSQTGFQELID